MNWAQEGRQAGRDDRGKDSSEEGQGKNRTATEMEGLGDKEGEEGGRERLGHRRSRRIRGQGKDLPSSQALTVPQGDCADPVLSRGLSLLPSNEQTTSFQLAGLQ